MDSGKTVSLYIHIPFCRKKCGYCDFFSVPNPGAVADSYVDSVVSEAKFHADFYGIGGWSSVYVGGGTPSLLSAEQVSRLFCGIRDAARIEEGAEVTVEMNPEGVRPDFLGACRNSGVNRVSLGIQALDDGPLSIVGRGCTSGRALQALSLLEEMWQGGLSVDFIAGLPGQSVSSFRNQFRRIFEFKKVGHISLYTLTVEENTPLRYSIGSGKVGFSQEMADRMWILGRNILEGAGFAQYEVSNFARRGFEGRHNSSYWRQKSYVGVGSGATGTMYSDTSVRWTNVRSVGRYASFWGNPRFSDFAEIPREVEMLDRRTLEFEFLMMGFRMLSGVDSADFLEKFGYPIDCYKSSDGRNFSEVFGEWRKNRLASESGTRLFLNSRGILLLNRFLEELI